MNRATRAHQGLQHLSAAAASRPDFKHLPRHWDPRHNTHAVKLLPGEYYVTTQEEMIMTVLGSCISVCVRDPICGIGGMNHFMLPRGSEEDARSWQRGIVSAAARYGNYAMELLVNAILTQGGSRKHLEVKIFGGGQILAQMMDIGQRNIAFIRHYVRTEGLQLVAEDVGDRCPRKVLYFPTTGKALIKKLRALSTNTIVERETQYLGHLSTPMAGDIELF